MKLPFEEHMDYVRRDFMKLFGVLGRRAIHFQEGIYGFGGDEHFPDFVSRFPVAWQKLAAFERTILLKTAAWSAKALIGMPSFRRGGQGDLLALAKHFKPKEFSKAFSDERPLPVREYFHSGHKLRDVCPNLMSQDGRELLIVAIDWGGATNEQLAKEFAQWLKENEPPGIARPDRRGHKTTDWRANLTRLAVMRLLSRFTALQIVDPRKNRCPAVWESKQLSRPKWRDVTKWHDARREAGALFHRLLSFLPKDEMPLSWERHSSAK